MMDLTEAHRVLNVPFGAPLDQVHAWHRYLLDQWNPERYRQDKAQYQRAQQETARVNAALATVLTSRSVPVASVIPHNDQKKGAAGLIVGGMIVFVIGLAITVGTLDHAQQEGGTYIVAYGPMVAGVVLFFQGLARSMKR